MTRFLPLFLLLAIAGCGPANAAPRKPRTAPVIEPSPVTESPVAKAAEPAPPREPEKISVAHTLPENITVRVKHEAPPSFDISQFTKHAADPTPLPTPPEAPVLIIVDTTVAVGEMAIIVPQTNCTKVRYAVVDKGLTAIPSKYFPTQPIDLLAWGIIPGDYRVAASGLFNGDITDLVVFTITVAGHGPQPPPTPPQPVPPGPGPAPQPPTPPTPGIETAQFLGIVIVDDVLRRQPATAAILADPIWQTLRKAGHKVVNYNITDPAAKSYQAQLTANGGQPVLVLTSLANNHWLNKDPADLKMQATPAGVQTLVNKYTGK